MINDCVTKFPKIEWISEANCHIRLVGATLLIHEIHIFFWQLQPVATGAISPKKLVGQLSAIEKRQARMEVVIVGYVAGNSVTNVEARNVQYCSP